MKKITEKMKLIRFSTNFLSAQILDDFLKTFLRWFVKVDI